MSKIIIENRSGVDDIGAIELVQKVMSAGRMSNEGKQYCYYTVFGGIM